MRYTLLILTPPDAGASARHALRFAHALLRNGHSLACVFFYDAGVLTANPDAEAPQDEEDIRSGWITLQKNHDLKLVACVASAHRFGVAHAIGETDRSSEPGAFEITGLGELIEAGADSDRLVTFRG